MLNTKRPGTVWLFSLALVLGMLQLLGSSMSKLVSAGYLPPLTRALLICSLVSLAPSLVFLALFFMLKKSSLLWLYVLVGLDLTVNLLLMNFVFAALSAVFGWVVWDYISHKQIDGQLVFS